MANRLSSDVTAEYCRFCGNDQSEFFGAAHRYVRWPADLDRADGVYHFRICEHCALSDRDSTEAATSRFRPADRDYLGTCDICGAVGCRSASRRPADDTYRLTTVLGWSVEIAGYDGGTTTCIDCSPIEPIDCVRRPDRRYDETAPRLVHPPFDEADVVLAATAEREHVQVGFEEWTA